MSIKFNFFWGDYFKQVTTMLIGTSPELELGLFTLCFRTRLNKRCPVSLGGNEFIIKTKTVDQKAGSRQTPFNTAYFSL